MTWHVFCFEFYSTNLIAIIAFTNKTCGLQTKTQLSETRNHGFILFDDEDDYDFHFE